MNLLLILRADILNIIILSYLIIYGFYCNKYRTGHNLFLRFALAAFGHVLFGAITEITVNSETVPPLLNDICHIIFFGFGLLFSLLFFQYAISLVLPQKRMKRYIIASSAITALVFITVIFSNIEYIQGFDTKYSAGYGPDVCYLVSFILIFMANVLLVLERKKVKESILFSIIPISVLLIITVFIQVLIPEFLFTESALTILALGTFFAIENPVGKMEHIAFVDIDTNTYNRNCYDKDCEKLTQKLNSGSGQAIAAVFCDLNGMKLINDEYGHGAGDRSLQLAASILNTSLLSASKIYRIGGDEFFAFYFDEKIAHLEEEVATVEKVCQVTQATGNVPLSISIGYAIKEYNEPLDAVIKRADAQMYEHKRAYYNSHTANR